MEWWKKEVIYQIYPRTFNSSIKGAKTGDIKGISEKMEYLKWLGIGGIWLCPIYKSPMEDNGYDVQDYYSVDPMFGTDEEFYNLLDKANSLDIKIIMDIVMSHTSSEHQWFKNALAGDKKYMDYYFFVDEPGEELSAFGGSAWEYVPSINKYYYHRHAIAQPDLNWSNPDVINNFVKIIDFWITKGIKGFRFDVVDLIGKKLEINPTKIIFETSFAHELLKKLNELSLMSDKNILKVGETVKFTIEDAVLSSSPEENELSMAFLFNHHGIDKDPKLRAWKPTSFSLEKLRNVLVKYNESFDTNGWNSIFWNNHDGPRIVSRWGNTTSETNWKSSAKMIFTVGMFLKGTPYVFQGEEIGMTNYKFDSIKDLRDIEAKGKFRDLVLNTQQLSEEEFLKAVNKMGRDHGRTWMKFNQDVNGLNTEVAPVVTNDLPISVEQQKNDDNSILNYCQKIIQTRKKYSEVLSEAKLVFPEQYINDSNILFFKRILNEKTINIIANWSQNEITLQEKINLGKLVISNYSTSNEIEKLQPFQAIVYES